MTTPAAALEHLRGKLLALKPSGPDGFEGLVADCLAGVSGLVFRLAKSGSQFGRDASSPPDAFAIAMEAKRYAESPRLEEVAGKAVVGGHALSDSIDVWVLAVTSEVGDDTVAKLTSILEDYGITLLTLDWTARPLPQLAVLIAAAEDTAVAWFERHEQDVAIELLKTQLDVVGADPAFSGQVALLRKSLSESRVGLDALRLRTAEWLHKRLIDRESSRVSFGQFVTVADPKSPAQPRTAMVAALSAAIEANRSGNSVIAVLGEEGIGKTWVVAQWIGAQLHPPIVLFVSGRRANRLLPADPLLSLATLLAEQEGRADEQSVASWRRRLVRWQGFAMGDEIRFVVVFDGINEHSDLPWADIMTSHRSILAQLGGVLIVTSRGGFWKREVTPRLPGTFDVKPVDVIGYSDVELAAVLARANITVAQLTPALVTFLRNPRVCSVALDLMDRIKLRPNDLTIERLLLEYWQARLSERGNLIAHNVREFSRLLQSHARAWRERPKHSFDRDEWLEHSGAAKRRSPQDLQNDLTEIEEGRFLTISTDDDTSYEFRKEVLPFAVGLLINDELKSALEDQREMRGFDLDDLLSQILDPIRGFDTVAEIVGSAVGLSCIDERFPATGRDALIRAWLGLQNIPQGVLEEMVRYVRACPEAFLNVAEGEEKALRHVSGAESIGGLLLTTRDDSRVAAALKNRIPQWLGRWSTATSTVFAGDSSKQSERHSERTARIQARLGSMSAQEAALFRKLTVSAPERSGFELDRLSALFLAGHPLAPYAEGLLGWTLVQAVAYDQRSASEELAWVVRLNNVDSDATAAAIKELVGSISNASSKPIRFAAASLLRLVGNEEGSAIAEQLSPSVPSERWRRAEYYCDTNPHDPLAAPGSNFENAQQALRELDATNVWIAMVATSDEFNLQSVTPALARFDHEPLIDFLRRMVELVRSRTGTPLRQLAWHLPHLSPLFGNAEIAAIRDALARLASDHSLIAQEDLDWVCSNLASAVIPHLPAQEQLSVLLKLPAAIPLFFDLRNGLKPLAAEELESAITSAQASEDSEALHRVLFFAGGSQPTLTDISRHAIASAMYGEDEKAALLAADVVFRAGDRQLNEAVLDLAPGSARALGSGEESWYHGRAIAKAALDLNRGDAVSLIQPRFLGVVAAAFGSAVLERLADSIEGALKRGQSTLPAETPDRFVAGLSISTDGMQKVGWVQEYAASDTEINVETLKELSDAERGARTYAARYRQMAESAFAFEKTLLQQGLGALVAPPVAGLAAVVNQNPERAHQWLKEILATSDPRLVTQLRNLGLAIASAYAPHDGALANQAVLHLRSARPLMALRIDGIELFEYAVFATTDVTQLGPLRAALFTEAFDDQTLESRVRAAEGCGSTAWLTGFVATLIESASPGERARGIAIAGLRLENSQSDQILARQWGPGFLADVASVARKNYERDQWARQWMSKAHNASNSIDYWRFATLAEGVVDSRFKNWPESGQWSSEFSARFGSELRERLRKAAEKRSKTRAKTLFGLRAPPRDLVDAFSAARE